MLTFTMREILASLLHAAIYGCFFALCLSVLFVVKGVIAGAKAGITDILHFEKIFPLPSFSEVKTDGDIGAVLSGIFIVLFAIGFSLLSYFSLDGEIRLYMLIIAFASFYLSKIVFSGIFEKLIMTVFRLAFTLISFVLRVIILPFRAITGVIKRKFSRFLAKKS